MSVWKRIAQSAATNTGTSVSAAFSQSTAVDSSHTLVAVLNWSSTDAPTSTSWPITYSISTGSLNNLAVCVIRGDSQRNAFTATFGSTMTQMAVTLYAFEGYAASTLDAYSIGTFGALTTATPALAAPGSVAAKTIALAIVTLSSGGGGTWGSFSDGFESAPISQSRMHSAAKALTTAGATPSSAVSWTSSRSGRTLMLTIQGTAAPNNAAPTVSAGPDKATIAGAPVSLTATATDSDGTIAGYSWTVTGTDAPAGAVTLVGASSATVTVTSSVPATVLLRCTATDNAGASASDDAVVTVGKALDTNVKRGTKTVQRKLRGTKEVVRRFRGGKTLFDKSLVAEWNFTESSGPFRATNGGLPLTAAGAAVPRVATPFGYGVQITSPGYLILAKEYQGLLDLGLTTQQVTIATWVYRTQTGTGFVAGAWQEDAADPRRSYGLFINLGSYGGAQKSCFHVSKNGLPTPGYPYSRDYSASGQAVPTGEWHLHVGTYDGAVARSYLDGAFVEIPSFTDNQGNTYSKNPYAFTAGLNGEPCDFTVGAVQLSGGMGNQFEGTVAKLRVYDRALSAGEVAQLYAAERTAL